ncbi:MAG: 4-phosphopantetheinyl transferase [Ilumatobacteraceae bacterium]
MSPVDAEAGALHAALRRIAPPAVIVGVRRIHARDLDGMLPDEAAAVAAAVPKRRREFASGRALLRELIGDDGAIRALASRAPSLPAGVRGSLAHDDTWAVAVITREPLIAALGVDVEPVGLLAEDVAALILRPEESGLDAHLAFTLKEAAYKAWSGLGGRMLDHHDVVVTLDGHRFEARIVTDDVLVGGTWTTACGRWLAIVAVSATLDRVSR